MVLQDGVGGAGTTLVSNVDLTPPRDCKSASWVGANVERRTCGFYQDWQPWKHTSGGQAEAVGPAASSNQAVGMQFAHLAAPGQQWQPSRRAGGGPAWNRRMMMGTMDKLRFPPILARCGRCAASLSRVCSLMLGICSPRSARDPGAQWPQTSRGPSVGYAKTNRTNFLIGALRLLLHQGAGICAGIAAQPCQMRVKTLQLPSEPCGGVLGGAARVGRVKTWEPRAVAGSGQALADQEWFEEAYQGSTIADVWRLVGWGARPGTAAAERWPMRTWRASVPQRARLPCWAG